MKKIININLASRLIPIEDTAYEMLKLYVESLKRYFDKEIGKEEIISDIESRIAELFQEMLAAGKHCITDDDVVKIIDSIGRPEELDAEENAGSYYYNEGPQADTTAGATTQDAYQADARNEGTKSGNEHIHAETTYTDKLYRNSNDAIITGVCSGIAHKLKLDPTLVRILYVLLTVGSIGLAFVLYLILSVFLPAAPLKSNLTKRLFRSTDNRMIAGVCSGLSIYLKIDVWLVRLLFSFTFLLQVFLAIIGGGGRIFGIVLQTFIFGSFTISFAVAYIVLWILIPVATTRSEKLQMQGKKVDLENIKNTVYEELNVTKEDSHLKHVNTGSNMFQMIGKIFKTLFVLFFALIVAALVVTFICLIGLNWATGPYQGYFVAQQSDVYLLWAALLLLFGISVLSMVLWVIRILTGRKKHPSIVSYIFALLWVVGLVCSVLFLTNLFNSYSTKVNVESKLTIQQPRGKRLVIMAEDNAAFQQTYQKSANERHEYGYTTDNNGRKVKVYGPIPQKYIQKVKVYNSIFNSSDFLLDADSFTYRALKFYITQSKDSLYHLISNNSSRGTNSSVAVDFANKIKSDIVQSDSVIYLPSTITLHKGEHFRMQHFIYNLQVPLGASVFIDRSVNKNLLDEDEVFWGDDFSFDSDWEKRDGNYQRIYASWRPNVEYIMTKKGLEIKR